LKEEERTTPPLTTKRGTSLVELENTLRRIADKFFVKDGKVVAGRRADAPHLNLKAQTSRHHLDELGMH
jgi:hypothetical protein